MRPEPPFLLYTGPVEKGSTVPRRRSTSSPPLVRRLKVERIARGLTQTAVARHARMNQRDLSQVERGYLLPHADQLERLAQFFGVWPPSALLMPVTVGTPSAEATNK